MATLTEYEASLLSQPGWQRFAGAGPAYALRQAIGLGESFAASRDRIAATEAHHRALTESENYTAFSTLSGA